ncbi:hypothetical protein SAMN04487910_3850 [Aquimarina amphilecti]|uniref:Uncharacterized protein n=1 Tax=Aquimarina amphilecti TaxID=1038014 RepID=A0A1H7URP6_AQUAM|nr:hypothetical protein [Aquimarina amphilecti]SEL99670.1 hypothetical protein SAMN04487910_3850 [Aquimarina amphilecti]
MKKSIIISLVLLNSFITFGQELKEINLLKADSTWGKEIIKVPFWFAPEIDYQGYEDIRFAKGWEDVNSSGFWTLVFAWDINLKTKPTTKFFEDNIKLYLDGLMKVVNDIETLIIPKTVANFRIDKTDSEKVTFKGTIETYDAFTTKKTIALNVIIESFYCKKSDKYVPFFRISPRNFDHQIWEELNRIYLNDDICNN